MRRTLNRILGLLIAVIFIALIWTLYQGANFFNEQALQQKKARLEKRRAVAKKSEIASTNPPASSPLPAPSPTGKTPLPPRKTKPEPAVTPSLDPPPQAQIAKKELTEKGKPVTTSAIEEDVDRLSYLVVAGSYTTSSNAQKKVDKLEGLGLSNITYEKGISGGNYTVIAGYFPTREEAKNRITELEEKGIKAFVKSRKK